MAYSATLEDGTAAYPVSAARPEDRATFLRQVYLMLFSGIVAFAMSAALPVWGFINKDPILGSIIPLVLSIPPLLLFALFIGMSFAVHAVSMVKGLNIIGFYLFAGFFGVLTSALLLVALKTGGVPLIMNAAALAIMAFGGLTCYVLITGKDFNFIGGFLTVGLVMLIGVTLFALVGQSFLGMQTSGLHLGLSAIAVILFSGYVLYDTSNIMHRYSTDMVVPAALALLIDFVILFRNILFLLMNARRD
jgi:FtsH-binding integral membrane protein